MMDCKCKISVKEKKYLTQNAIDEYGDTFKSSWKLIRVKHVQKGSLLLFKGTFLSLIG